MRAVYIARAGDPDVFEVRDEPEPAPGPGEVAIRVAAAGVNFADILARQGIYPDCPPYPCVVGYEVAGTVAAVGAGVDDVWLGREVMALTDFGGYAETAVVGVDYVWDKPPALSMAQAAAIPLNYITAWGLLVAMGGLKAGETVLIHNAGGGVGLAALDIARHLGAVTLGTASAGKHAFLGERGLDHAIDYRSGDWSARVLEITGGRGVELAIDPIGGRNWKASYRVLRATGRLGMFGISSASAAGLRGKLGLARLFLGAPLFHPARLIPGNVGVFGINIHAMYEEAAKMRSWMAEMLPGVEAGWLRPHVDATFPLERVGEAHAHIEARRNTGKVILEA